MLQSVFDGDDDGRSKRRRVYAYPRSVKCVAMDPLTKHANRWVIAGKSGQVLICEDTTATGGGSWWGGGGGGDRLRQTAIHQGQGPVYALCWHRNQTITWADDQVIVLCKSLFFRCTHGTPRA